MKSFLILLAVLITMIWPVSVAGASGGIQITTQVGSAYLDGYGVSGWSCLLSLDLGREIARVEWRIEGESLAVAKGRWNGWVRWNPPGPGVYRLSARVEKTTWERKVEVFGVVRTGPTDLSNGPVTFATSFEVVWVSGPATWKGEGWNVGVFVNDQPLLWGPTRLNLPSRMVTFSGQGKTSFVYLFWRGSPLLTLHSAVVSPHYNAHFLVGPNQYIRYRYGDQPWRDWWLNEGKPGWTVSIPGIRGHLEFQLWESPDRATHEMMWEGVLAPPPEGYYDTSPQAQGMPWPYKVVNETVVPNN